MGELRRQEKYISTVTKAIMYVGLKAIRVEFDIHKVVITLSYFTEIQFHIPLDSLLKSASIYML